MNTSIRENWLEALVGLVVIGVAVWFVTYAYARTSGNVGGATYAIAARFPSAAGVNEGTDVRVSGLKVGSVTGLKLDPKSYQAIVGFAIDDAVKLPTDSSAAITSQGILGGTYISLTPGGDPTMIKPGGEITDTSGSTDLMGLIGNYINKGSSSAAGAPKPDAGTPAAAAPGAAPVK